MNQADFSKNLTAKEIADLFRSDLRQLQRPANEIILDDTDVQKILKVSKRKVQYLKAQGTLAFSQVGVRSYYLLSDILSLISTNRSESVQGNKKLQTATNPVPHLGNTQTENEPVEYKINAFIGILRSKE